MRYLFLLILGAICLFGKSQIIITPFMPDEILNAYPDAARVMENKLNNILSVNGLKTQMGNSRFILTGNWIPETKDVIGSAPTQIAYTLNINLFIGDGESGTKYISETFRVKGVGATEEKAHLAAIRNLQSNSHKISVFIKEGIKRIIAYYEENKEKILSNINTLVSKSDYDEAVYQLCLIPMECSYYTDVQPQICEIYQLIQEKKSNSLFTEAKAIWAANQDEDGALQVIDLVSQIDPMASCYPAVQTFIANVNTKINLINERAYAVNQKKIAHQHEMDKLELETQRERSRQAAALVSKSLSANERLQSQRISAARDIAVAYVQNRPRTIVYKVSNWY